MNVKEKVVLITGGTGGLGQAVTLAFLKAGARVTTTYLVDSELTALQARLPKERSSFAAHKVDVLDDSAVAKLIEDVITTDKRLDCLINIVGGFVGGVSIAETSLEQYGRMVDLNLKSALLCSKHVWPAMAAQRQGKIVNIGAKSGLQGGSGMGVYSASKAALINLTQTLAAEGSPYNINANAVVPSIIDTEANREAMPDADFDRWVTPDKLARVILFLCSEDADDISGAILPVHGKV
jgi:NAD(P)-dependent dehydrogenase (short-subunit alcohol dehydrogenase family)